MEQQKLYMLLACSAVLLIALPSGHAIGPLTSVITGTTYQVDVGAADPVLQTGHPEWVSVGSLKFLPCLRDDPSKCLAPLGLPNPGQNITFPNVPDELFYYAWTTVTTARINGVPTTITGEVNIQGAYSTGFADPSSRMVFTRFRFIAKPALPKGNWVMQLPWGDFVWESDGIKDFHSQDRLRLPAENPLPQPEVLPFVMPDPTDANVFPPGSTTPAVDSEGFLTGPNVPVKYMFVDSAPGARTTTKFWSVPNAQTVPGPGVAGTQLVAEWDTATITAQMPPLPLSAPCATPAEGAASSCADFGHTSLNVATAAKTITLDNSGTASLELLDVVPVGPQAAAFIIDTVTKPAANAQVPPGTNAVSVSVTCRPTTYPNPRPAAGTSVTLSAQLRFMFKGRRAFDVPVTCHLDSPTTPPVTPPPVSDPTVTYAINTVLSKTAVYPLTEAFTLTSNVHDAANSAPVPSYHLASIAGANPQLLTLSAPPASPSATGVYQTTGRAAWDAAGTTQNINLRFQDAGTGVVGGVVPVAVKQDAITAILATPVTAPRRGTVWDWRIRWSSAAATELQPAQVAMRVHYLGTCTARLVAGFNALATNAEKIVYLNAPGRCTYKWSVAPLAPLLFNHQCDWAANGGCRIQASDGNPRFIENANQATMTRAGKAIAIWSEAGGLQVFQF